MELDEEFKCSLIRPLFEILGHFFPMLLEDIGAPATWFVTEPAIRLGSNGDAARVSLLAPEIHSANERFVLLRGKSTWELDAQLFEELHGVDIGQFFQSAAGDWPDHAERLDAGVSRL